MRREYRLWWKREGNVSPRSKRFTNMKRLNGYLRALTATTAEERYGDKVDQQWHCSGSSGDGYSEPYEPCYKNCEGKTWRQKFEDEKANYALIGALTEVRIESRELPAWTTETTMSESEDFKFGEIIRLSDDYLAAVPTGHKDTRLMVIDQKFGLLLRRDSRDKYVEGIRGYNHFLWTKTDD